MLRQIIEKMKSENKVFLDMGNPASRKYFEEVNYYQKKSGVEIDFITDKKYAYEVKIKAYEQDIKRLAALSKELKLKDYRIISRKYSPLEHVRYGFML